jgi:hypothetical protein
VTLFFPPGAVTSTLSLNYSPQSVPVPPLPGDTNGALYFTLEGYDAGGQLVTRFLRPYTMTITFTDGQLAELGVPAANLNVMVYNGNTWIGLLPCAGCTVDAAGHRITIVLDHFTEFALVARKPVATAGRLYVPFVQRGAGGDGQPRR